MTPASETPEERDARAAEYVLGTLGARESDAMRAEVLRDAELAAGVAAWERRLAPLQALAAEEAPPPGLWARIAQTLEPAAPAARKWRFPWPAYGLGASALAAGLAAFMVLRPAPSAPLMTVLLSSQDQPAWVVE